jgi:DNA-directed RNA polymerase subunit RPC12/RpoP
VSQQNSVQASADTIRKLWEKHGIKSPFRLLGFCLSLLPIPVIQQAGAALDRHLSDKALEAELERVWSRLEATNAAVAKVEKLEAAIAEIAQTVQDDNDLLAACEHLSATLAGKGSEFVVDTADKSYQEIVNSVVQAGRVFISATGGSTNVLENTKIVSPSTRLHASGGSRNFVDGTTFTDPSGTVGMKGIATQGNIHVSGNSVGFGPGSALIFGGNPNEVSGVCPKCGGRVTVDKRRLMGYSTVQCPHCSQVLPFSVG